MKRSIVFYLVVYLFGFVSMYGQTVAEPNTSIPTSVTYHYWYINDGCIAKRGEITLKHENDDVETSQETVFCITPTIATDNIKVSIEEDGLMQCASYTYKITSITGLMWLQGNVSDNPVNINVLSLEPNQYIISIYKDNQFVSSHHFIKE